MFAKSTRSILKYYLPYISVVMVSCAAVGLTIFWFAVSELTENAEQTERSQLSLAATDLETQFDIFKDIRDKISSNIIYSPDYLSHSAYREIELMQDFKQYQNYSVFCDNYFLYYPATGSLFTKESKYTSKNYFNRIRNGFLPDVKDQEMLFNALDSLTIDSPGTIIALDNDYFLLAYPILLSRNGNIPSSILAFIMNREDIMNRLEFSSGQLRRTIAVYYQDTLIGSSNYASENYITIRSDTGSFVIVSYLPEGGWYSGLNHFRFIVFVFLIISILVMILMIIAVTHKQYKPIRALAEKVRKMVPHDDLNSVSANEIKQIEHALLKIHQQSNMNHRQLTEQIDMVHRQTHMLRQQTLLLVLTGNVNEQVLHQMSELQIHLNGSFFCVFLLRFQDGVAPGTLTSIELLSDEDIYFYPVKITDTQVITICSFPQANAVDDAAELLEALSTSCDNSSFLIHKSLVVDSLDKIPVSYYSTQVGNPPKPAPENQITEKGWYHNDQLMIMLKNIREGNRTAALENLQGIMKIVQIHYPSILLQRNAIADITSQLLRLSRDLDVFIEVEEIGSLLLYNNLNTVNTALNVLINQIFDIMEQRKEQYESDLALRIRKYIDDHALDYDISLMRLAEEFQLSTKQINYYVRQTTGQTYKEYELGIRIQKAHELLCHSSMSIVQISDSIGYMDVSSFIKAFKNATGMTPAAFRKSLK